MVAAAREVQRREALGGARVEVRALLQDVPGSFARLQRLAAEAAERRRLEAAAEEAAGDDSAAADEAEEIPPSGTPPDAEEPWEHDGEQHQN